MIPQESAPRVSDPASETLSEGWRERLLQVGLQASTILGVFVLLFLLFAPHDLTARIVVALLYTILVLATWTTRLAYLGRAAVMLSIWYVASLYILIQYGIAEAALLFMSLVILTGLLFPAAKVIYYAAGYVFLNLFMFGLRDSEPAEWLGIAGSFILALSILSVTLHTLLGQVENTQNDAHGLLKTLKSERSSFEQRIEERTAGLARKTEQLRATSYIARKTAELQDLEPLLNTVAELVSNQFGFYHTGIFLLNEAGSHAVLQAASSDGGRQMIEKGHSLPVGQQSIVGFVAAQKKPRIALDVGMDAVFFDNPNLPTTRSEAALPLIVRDKVLGILDIQSEKPQAFELDDLDIFQTLADQIAIAIENARLLDETQRAFTQLETLTSLRTRQAWKKKFQQGKRIFTYTPLGLRTEQVFQEKEKTVQAAIMLRGQKIGTISVARKDGGGWNMSDQELLEEVANQVGLALDNIRLLEEATQRAKLEQSVGKLATRFSQSLDLDTLLQSAARELGQLPDVAEVAVLIGQDSSQFLPPSTPESRDS